MRKLIFILTALIHTTLPCIAQDGEINSMGDIDAALGSPVLEAAVEDMDNGRYEDAFVKLKISVETDSVYRMAYQKLYELYRMYEQHSEETIELLERGIDIYHDDDGMYFYIAEVCRMSDRSEEAIDYYTQAMKYARANGEDYFLVRYYYLNRGNLYLRASQFEEAISDYTYLLEIDPYSTSAMTNRGIAHFQNKQRDKACQDWANAVQNGFLSADEYYQKYCKD